jgi:hypothetical protein
MTKKSLRSKRKRNNVATRTDPALWERVKKSVIKSPKGGPPGRWSARKAQLAVALYKKSGGRYKGKKSNKNSLAVWTKEDWGYINGEQKSAKKSKAKGRYLPLRVRQHLTEEEKKRENRLKGKKYGKHIPYSESVLKKFRKYRG